MGDLIAYLVIALVGFIIGGVCGLSFSEAHTFAPWCWYGLLIAIGAPICIHGANGL